MCSFRSISILLVLNFKGWKQLKHRSIYELIKASSVEALMFPPSIFFSHTFKWVYNWAPLLVTPVQSCMICFTFSCLSLSHFCSKIIKQKSAHFLSYTQKDYKVTFTHILLFPRPHLVCVSYTPVKPVHSLSQRKVQKKVWLSF